jgi:hypothetical protein
VGGAGEVVCVGVGVDKTHADAHSILGSSQPTRDDPTGPSAAASGFGAMREEGETSAKRSGMAKGGRQRPERARS